MYLRLHIYLVLLIYFFTNVCSGFSDKDITIRVRILEKSKVVIKKIDFQTYLSGVVENEMPASWPLEALKAQAVVARSYALTKMKENRNKKYDLDSTIMDQVYHYPKSKKSILVVRDTDQIVLRTLSGDVLKAFYHSDCGGHTVSASEVWPGSYDSGTASDSWCSARESNRWSYTIKKENFLRELGQKQNQKLNLWAQYFNEQISGLKVNESFFSLQKIRKIFGFSNIKNSPTEVENQPESIVFRGQGYGHGAGLCQWGSLEQAKLGKNFYQILSHYYPKAQIEINAPARVASN